MAKFYKRKFYTSRDKYSVEQHAFAQSTDTSGNLAVVVVPSSTLQGMRKVKHLTVSLATPDTSSQAGQITAIYWALVYVPAGTSPSPLSIVGPDLYEPNQFVMNSGIVDPNAGPIRFHAPISRNLNSGDAIYLVCRGVYPSSATIQIYGMVRYAITLQ